MTTDRHCLDAETVAAWMDGGLDAAGVAAAEAHASNCERCQELLATVAKTLPATQLAPGTQPARGTLSFWWLAPLASAAAAVTIWMVVPQTPMQPPAPPPPAREMAEAPAKPQPQSTPASAREQSGELGRDKPAESAAPAPAPPATTPPGSFAGSRRNAPAVAANEGKAKLADAADTAKLDASASARTRSGELRRDAQEKREENKALASASAREPSGELRRDKPAVGAVAQFRKQVGVPDIVSPDPLSRWRASTPGTVERSEDGGITWIPVRVRANEEVLAGTAPGRLVCWLAGRNGLVLLATDGTNFTPLPFPESVDLVGVISPGPRIATVTTVDGRTFRTEDAGRNWRNP